MNTQISSPASITCVLSGILGNRTVSNRMLDALTLAKRQPRNALWVDHDAYLQYPVLPILRRSSELEYELVARQLLKNHNLLESDIYLVNSFILAFALNAFVPASRMVIATDATPAVTEKMHNRLARRSSISRRAYGYARDFRFRKLARSVMHWLPMSNTCAKSLVDDYGVPSRNISVTYAAQREIANEVPARSLDGTIKLLYVGNRFAEKGGVELCHAARALDRIHLTVVSNDRSAANYASHNIQVVSGLNDPSQIENHYKTAHLLVHPTKFDQYSNVILEGLAQGLPFLVTEGFGPGELVQLTGAGRHIKWPPTPEHIASAIQLAINDESTYRNQCESALRFAKSHLTMARFSRIVDSALL